MVLDTSAIVAILAGEPESDRMVGAIAADPVRLLSAATGVEAGIVVQARYGDAGSRELGNLLTALGAEVVDVGADHAAAALEAWRTFGKGRHAAGLNFGDVFPFALSVVTGEPILCKGDDFARTDAPLVRY